VDEENKRQMCRLLRHVLGSEEAWVTALLELISEVQDPLEEAPKAVSDPDQWLTMFLMAEELFQGVRNPLRGSALVGLKDSLLLPGFQQSSVAVRHAAVKTLGLYCVLDRQAAQDHLLLLLQVLKNDRTGIQLEAIKVLFDLLVVHGLHSFQGLDIDLQGGETLPNPNPTEEQQSVVVLALKRFLTHFNADLRTCAAEGLAKLFLADLVCILCFYISFNG
jgi:hypothetical protein